MSQFMLLNGEHIAVAPMSIEEVTAINSVNMNAANRLARHSVRLHDITVDEPWWQRLALWPGPITEGIFETTYSFTLLRSGDDGQRR